MAGALRWRLNTNHLIRSIHLALLNLNAPYAAEEQWRQNFRWNCGCPRRAPDGLHTEPRGSEPDAGDGDGFLLSCLLASPLSMVSAISSMAFSSTNMFLSPFCGPQPALPTPTYYHLYMGRGLDMTGGGTL